MAGVRWRDLRVAPTIIAVLQEMAFVDQHRLSAAGHAQPRWFEHKEESVSEEASEDVRQSWQNIVNRHLGRSVVAVQNAGRFKGRMRSGRFGGLHYCRVWASASSALLHASASAGPRHSLAMIVSGRVHLENGATSLSAGPGEFVLVKEHRRFLAEHDQDVEALVLFDPLQHDQVDVFGTDALVRRGGRSDAAGMLSRWLQDACADRGLQSGLAAESMAQVVQALAWEVMNERPVSTQQRLDRRSIESHVESHLDDPSLSLRQLADDFHCSIRTLHRVFRRDGEESLERYIQRQRVEACARRLLAGESEAAPSLTDLAYQYGFSSSSHFSNAFRARFGVSPSSYRRGGPQM